MGKWECCKCLEDNSDSEEVCRWCDTLREEADRVCIGTQEKSQSKESKGPNAWNASKPRGPGGPGGPGGPASGPDAAAEAMKATWAARRRRLLQQLAEVDFCAPEQRRTRLRALQLELHPDKHQEGQRIGTWFVKAQVAAAKEMEDLESRLQGSASSASRQRLGDAAAAIDKERIEVAELKKKEAMEPRRHLAGWQHYRKWCELVENRMTDRSVAWFQQMAGVPEGHRLESNQAVDLVVKVLVKKLETKAQPIKRAPRWMTMMIGPMEEMVVWREQPKGRRIAAWMKLVKMWAALRFSDAANMQVKTPKYYDGKMTADLHKAKTTGAGKRVQELPVYVGEDAYFVQKKWLEVGLDLIKTTWREASGASCDVIAALEDYEGNKIFPEGYERFWTEHSERSTFAKLVGKTDRDLIGRWLPEGSDQHVRTYNAAAFKNKVKVITAMAVKECDKEEKKKEGKRKMSSAWRSSAT
ncbi:unnamed protein product [Cladocopium goreaui]|uniref:RanBP2-type domain-containing protein n=1 Tax=Cladocopium goreaui TaxID=2562237 RepID=A0A9P1DLU4_9DINO|nr:unnamed protein product [Cladocopium goreaui]